MSNAPTLQLFFTTIMDQFVIAQEDDLIGYLQLIDSETKEVLIDQIALSLPDHLPFNRHNCKHIKRLDMEINFKTSTFEVFVVRGSMQCAECQTSQIGGQSLLPESNAWIIFNSIFRTQGLHRTFYNFHGPSIVTYA